MLKNYVDIGIRFINDFIFKSNFIFSCMKKFSNIFE